MLSGNDITNEGAAALADMIRVNTALETIMVRYNKITGEGCRRLAEAAFTKTNFTIYGPKALQDAVERHTMKEDALRVNQSAALLKVGEVFFSGGMSAYTLEDRYAQAHCWLTLAAAADGAGGKAGATARAKLYTLTAPRTRVWPLTLLIGPLCGPACLEESESICREPGKEREGVILPNIAARRRRMRRHRGKPHHPHDEF